jgi:hypothetical protein
VSQNCKVLSHLGGSIFFAPILALLIELVHVRKEVVIAVLLFGSTGWLDAVGGVLRPLENQFVELDILHESRLSLRSRALICFDGWHLFLHVWPCLV